MRQVKKLSPQHVSPIVGQAKRTVHVMNLNRACNPLSLCKSPHRHWTDRERVHRFKLAADFCGA